jgi:hypothetical protein
MDHRFWVFVRTALVLFVIVAAPSAALLVQAQGPQPQATPGLVPDNNPPESSPIAAPPAASPSPALSGGTLAPHAISQASSDDRDNSTPTGWYIYARQTPQQVADTISAGNRLVDIQVDAFSPSYLFTAAYVANSGSYQKTWWWYYGVDETALSSALSTNNARLISLKAYDIGSGQIRFTAVMISNTGADASVWWWYYNATPADISNEVSTNQARLTQINAYQTGGETRYAVVMVDNTGAGARGWWWYYNASVPDISSYVQTNNARLVDLDIDPVTGNFNVIMDSCSSGCPLWWWWVGVSESQLIDTVLQDGARIIDVNSYAGCGGTCYDILLINNSNDITSRVGEMLRDGTDGTKGLYLKQVGGPVLANLMDYYQFEPASSIKVAVHLYTMQQVQSGAVSLSTMIPQYQAPVSGSCPGNTVIGSESIQTADQEMMWHSDNTRTRELVDYFGVANINSMMTSIGMAYSSINHIIGCGGPVPDQTTLDDLALLYGGVANGTLLNDATRTIFYSQMAGTGEFNGEGYDWTHLVDTDIPNIIDQEAPAQMSTGLKAAFRAGINLAYKAGNYKICTSGGCATYVDHISIFGHAQIPFCDTGGPRQYVFGLFIYNATSDANSSATFNATKAELLREQIHAGLWSCFHQVYLPVVFR